MYKQKWSDEDRSSFKQIVKIRKVARNFGNLTDLQGDVASRVSVSLCGHFVLQS